MTGDDVRKRKVSKFDSKSSHILYFDLFKIEDHQHWINLPSFTPSDPNMDFFIEKSYAYLCKECGVVCNFLLDFNCPICGKEYESFHLI